MKKVAQHVSEPTKLKQTAADPRLRGAELRLPFKIYEDLENDCCQHCGQHKTANKVPNNNAKLKNADIETQTLGELNDLLCAGKIISAACHIGRYTSPELLGRTCRTATCCVEGNIGRE